MRELIDIRRLLAESNPHWVTGQVELPEKLQVLYRPQFKLLLEKLDKPQILGLLGIRRVGKSVLMRQLMFHLNKSNPAQNICQISFDEELVTKSPDLLDNIIKTFLARVRDGKTAFLFIDEIQFVENWQHILKRHYDRGINAKFIISGSSSLFIRKKTTESLAGRIFEFIVPPLSFWEYLFLTKQEMNAAKKLSQLDIDLGNSSFAGVISDIEEIHIGNPLLADKFDEYLCCRQFPEVASWQEKEAYEYIKNSVYKKTILYDIPRLFQIRNPDELGFLYSILMRESSNLLEINNLAQDAGINRNTVSSYLNYLRDALLHIQLTNATSSVREQRRLLKKGYVPSPNFTTTLLNLSYTHPLWEKEAGHMAETFVANVLWRKHEDGLHFYRKKDVEADFLITPVPGRLQGCILAEVKYSADIHARDLKPLFAVAEKVRPSSIFCITKNLSRIEKVNGRDLIFLPIWAF